MRGPGTGEAKSPDLDDRARGSVFVWRDVLAIVLIGMVLGIAYNYLGLSSQPPRGLPWVASARPLEKVEEFASATGSSADAPATAMPAGADSGGALRSAAGVGGPSFASGKEGLPRPAARSGEAVPEHPSAARAESESRLPAVATPTEAVAAAAPVTTGIRPGLPVIPDLGRPLQVELPLVEKFVDAGGALVVDAREREAFAAGHIPGAVNVPYEDAVREPAALERLDVRGRPVIVYCSGGTCESSRMLADLMVRDFAMRRVLVYEGGFAEWAKSGKPVQREPE